MQKNADRRPEQFLWRALDQNEKPIRTAEAPSNGMVYRCNASSATVGPIPRTASSSGPIAGPAQQTDTATTLEAPPIPATAPAAEASRLFTLPAWSFMAAFYTLESTPQSSSFSKYFNDRLSIFRHGQLQTFVQMYFWLRQRATKPGGDRSACSIELCSSAVLTLVGLDHGVTCRV